MSFRDRLSFASFSMFCFPNLFCCFIFSEAERVLEAMPQDVAREQHLKWLKEQILTSRSHNLLR
jgi:hypothetical protein